MERRVVLLMFVYIWGVSGEVDHAELRGEHPKQEHIDNGQCVPIPCVLGIPPPECKQLCDSRNYDTICQKPADFCLCRHMVHDKWKLVSPDEIAEELQDSSEKVDRPSEKDATDQFQERPKAIHLPLEPSKVDQTEEAETEPEDGVVSFQIFTVFLPIKNFLYESFNEGDSTPQPTADFHSLGYEPVNVHEGRLFWDFRYILTGLLLLMIGLVVYELVMCAKQVYGSDLDLPGQYEAPEVKVKIPFSEKEKILNI